MSCIGKLEGSLEMVCGVPSPAFNRIQGAKILNAADIASYTVAGASGLATITRVAEKVGYGVTTVNDALTLSVGMKSQDITPGAFDVTIGFKVLTLYGNNGGVASGSEPLAGISALAKMEIVVAVDHGNGMYRVYGLGAPLVCLEYGLDSTEDGYVSASYGVEDWQVGTTIHRLTKEDYDALSTPVAAPEAPEA